MEKQRIYFVIDMKSFFASVECAERGLDAMTTKLVVADPERSKKTICLAVSPEMKKFGIKNRCRLYEIPNDIDFIIATPRMQKYIDYAANIYEIYLNYFDKNDIHVYSIDECFIDVTDYLKLYKINAKEFAKKLIDEIQDKLHIPSSCGIGTNLYLAKIALDITAKHSKDRIGYLTEEKFKRELLDYEPIKDFWGISNGICERLKKFNVKNMKDITKIKEDLLYKEFGINAEIIIDHAWGKESCLMSDIKKCKNKSKSISSSQILPYNYNVCDAKIVLKEMVQEGCYRLIREHYICSHLNLIIGYGDTEKNTTKGSINFNEFTNLYSKIMQFAEKLFDEIVIKTLPIRKITFSFNNLIIDDYKQCDLFENNNNRNKEKKLQNCILNIKDKYGKNTILKAMDYENNATAIERNNQIGGHKSGTN